MQAWSSFHCWKYTGKVIGLSGLLLYLFLLVFSYFQYGLMSMLSLQFNVLDDFIYRVDSFFESEFELNIAKICSYNKNDWIYGNIRCLMWTTSPFPIKKLNNHFDLNMVSFSEWILGLKQWQGRCQCRGKCREPEVNSKYNRICMICEFITCQLCLESPKWD